VVNYSKTTKTLLRRMKYSFCSEEIYFPTVIMNSGFATKIINDNLRYIDWTSKRGGSPAILDKSDFPKLISSNKLFARKFDNHESNELKLLLLKHNRKELNMFFE